MRAGGGLLRTNLEITSKDLDWAKLDWTEL